MVRRSLVSLLLSVVVLSCKDSTGPDDLLGVWRLETVSGQSLPFVLEQDGAFKVELTGETVTLQNAGRQTMVTSFRVTDGGIVSTESIPASGNFTVNGSTLVLTFDNDPETYTAIVNGDLMTIEDIGLTFVYRRE
jgi:hypothetical protein